MSSIFKSLFVMFMLNLAVISVFGEKIIELRISPSGKLALSGDISNDGTTDMGSVLARKISWQIKDLRIASFQIVPKFPNARYPFNGAYNQPHTTNLILQVSFLIIASGSLEWQYTIKCTGVHGEPYEIDPKIAIKPGNTVFGALIGFLIVMFAGLFAIRSFRTRRKLATNIKKND